MYEKTLVLLKPDAVQRRMTGRIIDTFESAALKVHGMKFIQASMELSQLHYKQHSQKHFFAMVNDFLTSGPIICMVIGGINAVSKVRKIAGATEPASADLGSVRGKWGHQAYEEVDDRPIKNLVHTSEDLEAAEREIAIWFADAEIIDYPMLDDDYLGLE